MHLLVTGLSGTLAPRLAELATGQGWRVSGWDRRAVPADDGAAANAELQRLRPDAIAHLAIGSAAWAGLLARHARDRGIPMLFTSTAMVFDHDPDGPHDVAAPRNARDDYGRGKIECEDLVRAAHPQATIARLGWQIDPHANGNNMRAELDRWQARDGRIAASARWTPACSFMDDTGAALLGLLAGSPGATVHLDSNAVEAWTFDQVVNALKIHCDRDWVVESDRGDRAYAHDQRLVGGGVALPPLSARLPELRAMRVPDKDRPST